MHPNTFYSTLFSLETRDDVFVIMSFNPEFADRWENVIQPAIKSVGLNPARVDYRLSGESVVHDIIDGIAHSRLVLADITSSPMRDNHMHVWPQRNANVMWEVGIAHTMRAPDQTLMVRSDNEETIFDLTQFRAFYYDPTDKHESVAILSQLLNDRVRSIAKIKEDYIGRCAASITPHELSFLLNGCYLDKPFEINATMGNVGTIQRMFELGVLRTHSMHLGMAEAKPSFSGRCEVTMLGRAVIRRVMQTMNGVSDLAKQKMLELMEKRGGA